MVPAEEVFSTTLLCYVAVDGVCFTAVLKPKSGASHRLLMAFALFRLQGTEHILKQ